MLAADSTEWAWSVHLEFRWCVRVVVDWPRGFGRSISVVESLRIPCGVRWNRGLSYPNWVLLETL